MGTASPHGPRRALTLVSAAPVSGAARQRERTMQQQAGPPKPGQMMRVRQTYQLVELIKGPGSALPGGFYLDAAGEHQVPATYALDVDSRQINVYLVQDLVPEE